jgi:hypothetical protein
MESHGVAVYPPDSVCQAAAVGQRQPGVLAQAARDRCVARSAAGRPDSEWSPSSYRQSKLSGASALSPRDAKREGSAPSSLRQWQLGGARKSARQRTPRLPDARRPEFWIIAAGETLRGPCSPNAPPMTERLALRPNRPSERPDTERKSTVLRTARVDHRAGKYAGVLGSPGAARGAGPVPTLPELERARTRPAGSDVGHSPAYVSGCGSPCRHERRSRADRP